MRKDDDWATIENDACQVIKFLPAASVKNGKVVSQNIHSPYGSILLASGSQVIEGHITHKDDFLNLWRAFQERGVAEDEEVLIIWTRNYKYRFFKLFSMFLPKLWVMVCPKGALALMKNPDQEGFSWDAIRPKVEYKPEVLE